MAEDRRAIWSWCFYDFANSPFTTLVVTFIYGTFFANVLAADHFLATGAAADKDAAVNMGTELWSRGVVIAALTVALVSPFLGALSDRGGYRKLFLFLTTSTCVLGSLALYGIESRLFLALAVFVVANTAFEMGMVFYNAFLPEIAPPEKIGRVSGYGWGLGYGGGLLALVIALVTLVQPEVPMFGFTKEGGENIRATNLLVAGWLALFSIPLFLWVKEDKSRVSTSGSIFGESFRQLRQTFRDIQRYRQIVRFLVARLIYNDGLVTVFAFGGIYAQGTFGFSFQEILLFGIALNVAAGLGAVVFGFLDDKLGGRRTLEISIIALAIATVIAVVAPNKTVFWAAGFLLGIFAGPTQAASRSLLGRFAPEEKKNEFFGFYALSGKATAFLGPLLLGQLTVMFNSQRVGVGFLIVLFVVGYFLLRRVDEEEGIRMSGRT